MRRHFSDDRPARGRHSAASGDSSAAQSGEAWMTSALLLARQCIIYWVTISLTPIEFTYDIIEAELQRRGIDDESAQEGWCWEALPFNPCAFLLQNAGVVRPTS
jgi:hypothetical protein